MPVQRWPPLAPPQAPGEPNARADGRSCQTNSYGTATCPTAGSAYRWTLNKAFTIGIDVLLSMLTGQRAVQEPLNQALPPRSLRSFGRMSVNRSKDCTGGAGVPLGGSTHRLFTVCAKG